MNVLSAIWGAVQGFWNWLPNEAKLAAVILAVGFGSWTGRGCKDDAEFPAKVDSLIAHAPHQVTTEHGKADTLKPPPAPPMIGTPVVSDNQAVIDSLEAELSVMRTDSKAFHDELMDLLVTRTGRISLDSLGWIDWRYRPPEHEMVMLPTSRIIVPGHTTIHDNALVAIPAQGSTFWQKCLGVAGAGLTTWGIAKKNPYVSSLGGAMIAYWITVEVNL